MVGDIETVLLFNGVEGLHYGGEYVTGVGFDGCIGCYSA